MVCYGISGVINQPAEQALLLRQIILTLADPGEGCGAPKLN